jgi:hypothetical protein
MKTTYFRILILLIVVLFYSCASENRHQDVKPTASLPSSVASITTSMQEPFSQTPSFIGRSTSTPIPTPIIRPQDVVRINLDKVDQIGGSSQALTVQGSWVYLGVGQRLILLDVSNPSKPLWLAQSNILDGIINSIAISGSYIYLATPTSLVVLEVSDNQSLITVAQLTEFQEINDIKIDASIAYLASGHPCIIDSTVEPFGQCNGNLWVVDISNPLNPRTIASMAISGQATSLFIKEGHLYLADDDQSMKKGGLRVIDISNPEMPYLVKEFNTGSASAVVIVDNLAFMAGLGISMIDITDPLSPTLIDRYLTDEIYLDMALYGQKFYLVERFCHFGLGCKRHLSMLELPDFVTTNSGKKSIQGKGIAEANQNIYFSHQNGLSILDITGTLVGVYETLGPLGVVAVSNEQVYTARGEGGHQLHIFTFQNHAKLEWLRSIDIPVHCSQCSSGISAIAIEKNKAYLTLWDDGISILNLENSESSIEISHLPLGSQLNTIDVKNNYVYVNPFDGTCKLAVVDVSDPEKPILASLTTTPGCGNLRVIQDFAYLAMDGLYIFDLHQRDTPHLIGKLENRGTVFVDGSADKIFMVELLDCSESTGCLTRISVLDVQDPFQPIELGSLVLGELGMLRDLELQKSILFLLSDDGLYLIDVTDPWNPALIGHDDVTGLMLASSHGYIYIAGGDRGLIIIDSKIYRANNP